ncbi:hypothetical protein HFO02_09265 [Rhizobium laguerreae]|uniref:hypothetical protein n=1 Tax=Rhizobium laguerreae TaxID=1076926 RepID=UPI001C9047DC|nr:hypothetical protein [Rhizobium laguerreae]MBY3323800.1 hypothetical protein [Rhizobium laguerreae]
MNISGVVEVCISLAFLYLVLSLMVTTINEIIATWFRLRSKNLSHAIGALLDDQTIKERFYAHGLVKNAIESSHGGYKPAKDTSQSADTKIPTAAAHSAYLESRSFAMALLGSLDPVKPIPVIGDIKQAIEKLPPGNIRDIVGSAIAAVGTDIEKVRDAIAESFDAAMDRLSGQYQRNLRWISVCIGIALAAVLNADSLKISVDLWNDRTLREQTVSAARDFSKAQFDKASEVCVKPATVSGAAPTSPTISALADSKACVAKLQETAELLRPFPLGWKFPLRPTWDPPGWGLKGFGLVWTGLALSFGAPFWFDVLQKFINIRGTGVKPEPEKQKK